MKDQSNGFRKPLGALNMNEKRSIEKSVVRCLAEGLGCKSRKAKVKVTFVQHKVHQYFKTSKQQVIQKPRKKYECPECLRTLSSKSALESHKLIHSGEKPFPCECGKRFRTKDSLTKHERIHSGEKPYSCNHCGKSFTQNSSWRLHLRIHTGEKPFRCEICSRSFTQRGNLKAHSKIHL